MRFTVFAKISEGWMHHGFEMEKISMEELEKRPGIVGYIVKEGDDLWTLAKRYSTTKEGIMEVNEMTDEMIKPGDRILIFKEKYEYTIGIMYTKNTVPVETLPGWEVRCERRT